jgi:hypothetical protein
MTMHWIAVTGIVFSLSANAREAPKYPATYDTPWRPYLEQAFRIPPIRANDPAACACCRARALQ